MRSFIFSLIIIIFSAIYSQTICAQQRDIVLTGTVTDHQGEPLPGVTIRVRNTQFGTVTDADGRYLLRGRWEEGDIVIFSFIGMKNVRVKYVGQKVQDAAMQQDTQSLEEVVVVARPNINEMDIRAKSGVVQRVDMERLNSKPMIDMSLALQGTVPGLIVTNTGDLGSKPKIRIRGNSSFREGDTANEPLYVMDGKVISSDAFMTLNPSDLKEIKVLKDAVACALYGIKAANGVIEITSLRGNPDGRLTTNYSFNMGITTRGRRGVEMMDTDEKLELERRLQNASTPGYRYSEDYYRKYFPNSPDLNSMIAEGQGVLDSLRNIHTDWFDELIHRSIYQRHNLSVRGGTENTSYYISANYAQQGGRVPGNDTHRFTAHMSLDQKLGRWGYLSLSTDAGYSETDTPNGSSYSPTDLVYQLNPYETTTGKLVSYSNASSDYTYNDLVRQYNSKSTDKRGGVSGSLNLEPVKGLNIDAVAGIDVLLNEMLTLVPSTALSERVGGVREEERGKLTKGKNVTTNVSSNVRITYNKEIAGKHDLTFGGNMDGGIVDNQGFEPILLAEQRMETSLGCKDGKCLDLIIVSDVASPYMSAYQPSDVHLPKGLNRMTLKKLTASIWGVGIGLTVATALSLVFTSTSFLSGVLVAVWVLVVGILIIYTVMKKKLISVAAKSVNTRPAITGEMENGMSIKAARACLPRK